MLLTPSVRLVGSGWLGSSLTHALDCNVYLVGSADDAVLVDAGCGLGTAAILREIDESGIPRSAVRRILVTHSHADHAAGAAALAVELGAEVIASVETARILEHADEDAAGLVSARATGLYPPEVRLTPTPVTPIADRVSFSVGDGRMTTIATPGHATGHLCFLWENGIRAVFTGDLVFARGRVAVLAPPDTDVALLGTSVARVARTHPAAMFAGHGEPVLTEAPLHLEVAVRAFENHTLPPPLIN